MSRAETRQHVLRIGELLDELGVEIRQLEKQPVDGHVDLEARGQLIQARVSVEKLLSSYELASSAGA